MERRIVDLEARLAASETNLRKAEERSASAESRVDDACALVRELSSGPRLRAAEDRASAACARVADVEKALHAALRSLGEKGLTNLLEEDEEETTPLSERLAAAEVAVEAAQATALGATSHFPPILGPSARRPRDALPIVQLTPSRRGPWPGPPRRRPRRPRAARTAASFPPRPLPPIN